MEKKFSDTYKAGILSKELFLKSPMTNEFITWIIPFISGERDLNEIHYDYKSFVDAIDSYSWGMDKDFSDTYNRFVKWRIDLKNSNESVVLSTCIDILNWGGVLARNEPKIKVRKTLKEFLANINKIIETDEIIIDDLNPNYINSGFTKIYTALNNKFIMYDGRVGSALCYLIKSFLIETEQNEIPTELIFGFGLGRGNSNRNPNDDLKAIRFSNITQNRTIHFVSNIKANWLLKSISEKVQIPNITSDHEKIFALQTALFVLGKEIPTPS